MARIPAMTTGMIHFMISSGRITDMAAIPTPDLAVPYAAPRAVRGGGGLEGWGQSVANVFHFL